MRKLLTSLIAAAVVIAPANAAGWQDSTVDVRPGAFVGARLKLPLGERTAAKPRAELAIAPTQSRISSDGRVRTRIGEGVALNLQPGPKPGLTLGERRADALLGLQSQGRKDVDRKLGISTLGVVLIGAALAGGIYFLYLVHEAEENTE